MFSLEQLKALIPDHAVEGIRPVQHYAPVPNNCSWTELALIICFGAALLTHGAMKEIRYQVDAGNLRAIGQLHARALLLAFCMLLGALVGMQTWDIILGMAAGAVGSLSSPLFVAILKKFLQVVMGIRNNGNNEKPAEHS